jgi:hypothetical protein
MFIVLFAAIMGWGSTGFGCAVGDNSCNGIDFWREAFGAITMFTVLMYTLWGLGYLFWIAMLRIERAFLRSKVMTK